ncbi:MAG: pseudouridine synthase [Bacilli bacterium]
MRIDKFLAHTGFGTRKEVKNMLKKKEVLVNGTRVKDAKFHVNEKEDEVSVDGTVVEYVEFIYLMMNKPDGVISATEDNNDETVIDLLDPYYADFEPFPMGRLDKDTEGLLLISNDGKLAHNLLSPKKHVSKRYEVFVKGKMTEKEMAIFQKGITLDEQFTTLPASMEILEANEEQSHVHVIIQEGKFHQIKRMFEAVGSSVTYLKRLSMGPIILDESLECGEYRELNEQEMQLLAPYLPKHEE